MTRKELLKIIGDYESECPNPDCGMPFTAAEFLAGWTHVDIRVNAFTDPTPDTRLTSVITAPREVIDVDPLVAKRGELGRLRAVLADLESQGGGSVAIDKAKEAGLQAKISGLTEERKALADYRASVKLRAAKELELEEIEAKIETAKADVEAVKTARDELIGTAVDAFCERGAVALKHVKDNLAVRTLGGKFALGLESEFEGFRAWESLSGGEFLLFNSALVTALHGCSEAPNKLVIVNDLDRVTPAASQCDYLRQLAEMVDAGTLDQVLVEGACLFEYETMTDEERAFVTKYRERILSYGYSIIELDGRGELTYDDKLKTTYKEYRP